MWSDRNLTKRSTTLLLFTHDKPHALSLQVAISFLYFPVKVRFFFLCLIRFVFESQSLYLNLLFAMEVETGEIQGADTKVEPCPATENHFLLECVNRVWSESRNPEVSFLFYWCMQSSFGSQMFPIDSVHENCRKKCITNWNCSLTHI